MIKRNASNKLTPSLVNTAQEEHQNVTRAIKDGAPITDLTSVVKSINFDTDTDGAFVLRNPLILKQKMSEDSFYLYDNVTFFNDGSDDPHRILSYKASTQIKFVYYDLNFEKQEFNISNDMSELSFIKKYFEHTNIKDATIIAVKINRAELDEKLTDRNLLSILYPEDKLHYNDPAGELYRFIKIYISPDSQDTLQWVIELVHPELNTITSNMDTLNTESLDFNMLLDNPYAVRDLYNYGANGTTKILAYSIKNMLKSELKALQVYELTESKNADINIIDSTNTIDRTGTITVLKAFITTMKFLESSSMKYYCCWEYSTNGGVDWKPYPKFISQFAEQGKVVTKNVSDLTSIDFEKTLTDESLTKSSDYIVEKQMVVFDSNAKEDDIIESRPDILILDDEDLSFVYRFQVYVDTGKEYPKIDPSDFINTGNVSKIEFSRTGFTAPVVFGDTEPANVVSYSTYKCDGENDPSLDSDKLVLSHVAGADSILCGNTLVLSIKNSKDATYEIMAVEITVPASGSSDTEEYKIGCVSGTIAVSSNKDTFNIKTIESTGGSELFLLDTAPTDANNPGYTNITLACCSNTKNVKISSIKVYYKKSTEPIKTTSTYLISFTGNYSFKYSKGIETLEDLTFYREQLFKGKLVYYDEQLISFNKYNVYYSAQDSLIFKLLNNLTFGTEVTKIIKWRSYLVIFTSTNISLVGYSPEINNYVVKTISTNIGVSLADADTVNVILNTIYFKSGLKVYKLTLNAYTSDDSLLNLRYISLDINTFLNTLGMYVVETHNFSYADSRFYYIFINSNYDLEHQDSREVTYCLKYDYALNTWNILKYNLKILNVELLSVDNSYLRTKLGICHFKEDPKLLLSNYYLETSYRFIGGITEDEEPETIMLGGEIDSNPFRLCAFESDLTESSTSVTYADMLELYNRLPYADYYKYSVPEIYEYFNDHIDAPDLEVFSELYDSIDFNIDFGQKSSTYTLTKQFLETKFIFGTFQLTDTFPISLDIETDGESMASKPNGIHIDANTDSALWKVNLNDKGTLNTVFAQNTNTNYNGIIRQLIVKYSGKGKTIRYLLSGSSNSKFKFYSLNTRYRILAKKQ